MLAGCFCCVSIRRTSIKASRLSGKRPPELKRFRPITLPSLDPQRSSSARKFEKTIICAIPKKHRFRFDIYSTNFAFYRLFFPDRSGCPSRDVKIQPRPLSVAKNQVAVNIPRSIVDFLMPCVRKSNDGLPRKMTCHAPHQSRC